MTGAIVAIIGAAALGLGLIMGMFSIMGALLALVPLGVGAVFLMFLSRL